MSSREERTALPDGWTLVRHDKYWGKSPAWFATKLRPDGYHAGHVGPFARRRDAIAAYRDALKVTA